MKIFPETEQVVTEYRPDIEMAMGANAQRFESGGNWWLALPHAVETVRLLRNLGIGVESPALHYYDWCGGKPFDSQKSTVDMCTINRRAFVLSEMGVGKTRAVLWAYDYLRRLGLVHKLLVVAPLSTLTTVWDNEIFENFHHLRTIVLYGDKKKRLKLLAQDADVYIINHDGVEVLHAELFGRADIDCCIIDELAAYRNSRSLKWKQLAPIVKRSEFSWGLTGSPTPTAPTDAYGQARLLVPDKAGYSFKAFKERTMRQVGTFKWIERAEAPSIVHETLQPAVRFTREQCFDLPPTTYSARSVILGPECQAAYKKMLDELSVEINNHEITAANEGVKLSKLLQIASGFAYDAHGAGHYIGGIDRFKAVLEIIGEASGKVIVFAPFRYLVEMLGAVVGKYYPTGIIHGDTSKSDRDRVFTGFQRTSEPRVIVAHPQTMAHGLTLTAANTIVWATPHNSPEIYEQANARITRSGQTQNTHIIHVTGSKVEDRVYARLKNRLTLQGTILELFE